MTTPWESKIPVLPTLITVGSLLCGFGAIVMATLPKEGVAQIDRIEFAAWLVLVAMIFDALDGRVARMSNQVSAFGGELDSLCDAVSFGVAPAVVSMAVMSRYFTGWEMRLAWGASALFAVCAVLRLARFNVANQPDEESHRSFQGLPSPGGAGMIVSFVILHANLVQMNSFEWVGQWVLPALLLTVGPLMVSRVRYVHLIGELTRGERSFTFFLGLVVLLFLVVVLREYIIPVIFTTYILSGLVGVAVDKVLDRIDRAQDRDSFSR